MQSSPPLFSRVRQLSRSGVSFYLGDFCGLVLVEEADNRLLDFSGTLLARACTADHARRVGVDSDMVITSACPCVPHASSPLSLKS
jgi:hypothetical protein